MKELSMHILDIVQNSISACSKNIKIIIDENTNSNKFDITIQDDGNGMDKEFLENIKNPFYTSRTTRKVGLGIPMLSQTCETCGGYLTIESKKNEGTKIFATMEYKNIDRPPLGDIINSVHQIVIMNEEIDFFYLHKKNNEEYILDTKEIKEILEGISFKEPEIMKWIKDNLTEGLYFLNTQ